MSRIRGKDTGIELTVRYALHSMGLRYRLGGAGLPGRPDLVFPRYRKVVFVNGCFWHGHTCHLFRLPKTRTYFWEEKIGRNRMRDARAVKELKNLGWKPITVWECQLRGRTFDQKFATLTQLAKDIKLK